MARKRKRKKQKEKVGQGRCSKVGEKTCVDAADACCSEKTQET